MSLPLIPVPVIQRFSRNDPKDIRIGEIIEFAEETPPDLHIGDVCLIGFPEDRGVVRNHGREGARGGPEKVRDMLYRLPAGNMQAGIRRFDRFRIYDLGLVQTGSSLEEAQYRLGSVVAYVLHHRAIPVVIGGGHETAYGHFLGYVQKQKAVSVINFDAHLDVRVLPADGIGNSGTPFRQMIEHPSGLLSSYAVLGIQPNSNSAYYLDYAREKSIRTEWLSDFNMRHFTLKPWVSPDHPVYATIDIDCFPASVAPGCSAPPVTGVNTEKMLVAAYDLGENPAVTSFDICEVNPLFDSDNRTAKLAALLIYQFLSGLSHRNG
ncbi:MAG: formimidoylglutamase [Bacteroidetes bacterium]|nr:formimidoylglutamase [Bacteroidota bacterium]